MVNKEEYNKRKTAGTCCHDSRPLVKKYIKVRKRTVNTTKCRKCHKLHKKFNSIWRNENKDYMRKWLKKHPNYMKDYWFKKSSRPGGKR